MRRPPDAEILRRASAHVLYEIQQLGNAYTLLMNADWWGSVGVPTYMAQTAHNALVESFAIHVRCLDAFLHDKPRSDDMCAGDWFGPWEWDAIRARDDSDDLLRAGSRVNKEIAHLTYARLSVTAPAWPHQEVVDRLRTDLFRFLDGVDMDLVVDGFKAAAWQALPWPHPHPGGFVRGDAMASKPVATSGFGIA